MPDEILQQPLARAVLAKLAQTHTADEPLGSFARTVLRGEASLRGAVALPWHGQALDEAFRRAQEERRRMPTEQRERIEREATLLREVDPSSLGSADLDHIEPPDGDRTR